MQDKHTVYIVLDNGNLAPLSADGHMSKPIAPLTWLVAAATGTFPYVCAVTTPDGTKHGWRESSVGGGTVEVGSGSRSGEPK